MANPVMETVTFRLLPGTDSAAFLAAARATAPLVAAALMADPVFQPFVAMIDGASARMRHPAILWRMA
jgi:hypothetical protein